MAKDVYDPLDRYNKEFASHFFQVVDHTFQELEQKSGVDRKANVALCLKIKKLEAQKQQVESKTSFYGGLRFFLIIVVFVLIGAIFFFYNKQQGVTWVHLLEGVIACSICALIFTKINPRIKNLNGHVASLNATIEGLKTKAWEQMKPLNDLYDWGITARMIQKVVPKLEFDNFVHQERLAELINEYNLSDLPETQSVVAAQSGEINGNPFVFAQFLSQEWQTKTYYGSIVITWREAIRGTDGKIVYVMRTQTLTASVNAPEPNYLTHSCLIYGNDSAPNLSFSRTPSKHSGEGNDGFFANWRKKRDLKRLTKFSQKLDDDSQYTLMANKEFELLFETTNRTDEKEYRLLFTPLAQRQMLRLINDRKIGFGDDFTFRKESKINVIFAEHLKDQPIDTSPSRYFDYDIVRAEATFKRFNIDYFKSIYFAFAPLLAIPLYQQMRPLRKIYGANKKQSSNWELESIVNYYGEDRFKSPNFETPSILKAHMAQRYGRDGMVSVTAHGFYTEKRLTTVSMLGGDGNVHAVPVEWLEYFPISNTSSIMVRECEDNEFADDNQTVVNEFCDLLGKFAGDNVLARRNILSGIMRKQ